MTIKVLAFTSCGHCPLAIVELHGKCQPMDVYCPLQFDEDGGYRKVYSAHLLAQLGPNCPIPSLEKWQTKLLELRTEKGREDFVIETRFFSRGNSQCNVEYSRKSFRKRT